MSEQDYQLERFYDKYDKYIPKRVLKKMFVSSWNSTGRLGSICKLAEAKADIWLDCKEYYKK